MTKRSILVLIFLPPLACAQRISPGLIGGVPAQPPVQQSTDNIPFVLGPTLSVELFHNFSAQTGVLFYRLGTSRQNYFFAAGSGFQSGMSEWKAHATEIPLLLRYHLLSRSHTWRPFATLGPTVRRTEINFRDYRSLLSSSTLTVNSGNVPALQTRWKVDPVLGAGVSFKTGRLHLEPEVRYSYWGAGKDTVVRKNQVNFLFGLRF